MPIFDFQCPSCGNKEEIFLKGKTTERICSTCHIVMYKLPPLIAKTPDAWGVNWRDGLQGSGVYSTALGKKVSSRSQERKILEAKGFIPESDLGKHWFEDTTDKQLQKQKQIDKMTDTYTQIFSETGSKEEAIVKAFPADKCLDGSIESVLDTTIKI